MNGVQRRFTDDGCGAGGRRLNGRQIQTSIYEQIDGLPEV
jgi:hypothetical protein